MLQCITCAKELSGRQKLYCSRKCHNTNGNTKYQNYHSQQTRGRQRKSQLMQLLGGSCDICGYSKNTAALCFHHLDPDTKKLSIDIRACSNNKMKILIEEAKKCQLLCSNCHMEIHYPNYETN